MRETQLQHHDLAHDTKSIASASMQADAGRAWSAFDRHTESPERSSRDFGTRRILNALQLSFGDGRHSSRRSRATEHLSSVHASERSTSTRSNLSWRSSDQGGTHGSATGMIAVRPPNAQVTAQTSARTRAKAASKSRPCDLEAPTEKGCSVEYDPQGDEEVPNLAVWLFRFRKPGDMTMLCVGAACAGIAAGANAIQGFLVVRVVTIPALSNPNNIVGDALLWGFIYLGIAIIVNCTGCLEQRFFGIVGEHLTTNLRVACMTALLRQEISYFDMDEHTVGHLTGFLSTQITYVQSLLSEKLQLLTKFTFMISLAVIFMFVFGDWRTALLMLAVLPIVAGLNVIQARAQLDGVHPDGNDDAISKKSASALIGEVAAGIHTVASFNLERHFHRLFTDTVDEQGARGVRRAPLVAVTQGVALGSFWPLVGGVLLFGGYLVTTDQIDDVVSILPGGCVVVELSASTIALLPVTILGFMATYLGQIGGAATDAAAAADAAQQLYDLISRNSRCDPMHDHGMRPSQKPRGEIEFVGVVFSYPTRADCLVCRGYTLRLKAGERAALCGPSGGGKSTAIALLERFYDPLEGSICLDGFDLRRLNVHWLRSQLGLVGQEPVLFEGSIAENITYAVDDELSQEAIEAVAAMANAHAFITQDLADGYQTNVGSRGTKLSGGQKQRIAIARALARDPPILLLDEATSALDADSERIVQMALDNVMATRRRTSITIAHRLSTIQDSELIAVVNHGKVVEKGTHNELMQRRDGLYASLIHAQSH